MLSSLERCVSWEDKRFCYKATAGIVCWREDIWARLHDGSFPTDSKEVSDKLSRPHWSSTVIQVGWNTSTWLVYGRRPARTNSLIRYDVRKLSNQNCTYIKQSHVQNWFQSSVLTGETNASTLSSHSLEVEWIGHSAWSCDKWKCRRCCWDNGMVEFNTAENKKWQANSSTETSSRGNVSQQFFPKSFIPAWEMHSKLPGNMLDEDPHERRLCWPLRRVSSYLPSSP